MSVRKLVFAAFAISVVALPTVAETVKPAFGGDFTFRRVKPPKAGTTKRITIQIAPDSNPFPDASAPLPKSKGEATEAQSGVMAWFWDEISPSQDASGPGRFVQAVEQIGKAPFGQEVPAPRLDALYAIAEAHGTDIIVETIGKRLSPAFVLSVISVDSGGRISAESEKGAQG